MKRTALPALVAAACLYAGAAPAQDYRIEHMEPAFWWTGMQNKSLQLMVHGKRIADLEPSLNHPGVRVASVSRVPNRNYLFIDLVIENAAPGKFDIVFSAPGKKSVSHRYELQARAPGSAQRKGFSSADAIYQVMPDRFVNGSTANDNVARMADKLDRKNGSGRHGGDLQGMTRALDYIADLGYTMIWPTPLVENDMPAYSYHGYSATDYYKIDERYGSNEDYRDFAAKAKARGIGVIQDVVLNHIGLNHWWMRDLPMPDWVTNGGKYVPTEHHRVAVQDPYAARDDKDNFTQGWFSPNMPDMNQANPRVATYLIQNTIWWIEYAGLAGLRVDTYGYSDNAFLSEWSRRVMEEYPRLNLVGEEWSNQIPVVARWLEGKRNPDGYVSHMPSMMDFPLNDTLRKALPGPDLNLGNLYETLSQDHLYPDAANLVLFEGNHDLPRTFSVLDGDDALFRMAMAYVLTVPRIPQLYYGTEIQMTSTTKGRDDPSYRQDFPGGWDGDQVNAFTGAGLTEQQKAARAYLKKLLNWRKSQPVIHHGKLTHYGPRDNTYVYFRHDGDKKVMVAFNKNDKPATLKTARFHEMLAGVAGGTDVVTGQRHALRDELTLPARSAVILELDRTRGEVKIVDNVISPQLGNSRSLRIYLPPSYATRPERRYPVLYMHDGQNLFDPKTAYSAEWEIDETMDRLIAEGGMAEAIVVGIDNTKDRLDEYTPCCDPKHGGGKIEQYESFIVDTVKPYVDGALRTLPGKEHTAIMGSSLGGIASVHIAQHRPDVFSKAGGVSSSFWWNEGAMTGKPPMAPVKFYIDAGTANDGVEQTRLMRDAMVKAGYRVGTGAADNLYYHEDVGGIHNEKSWAARAHLPLTWFFPPSP
ncbi:alpha-amylase family glycosyl hydrolase [Pseudoduganella namucuonensis]|uniref:Glycosidase n=1 Tax=Pseudoduganella namucuonensis TaxID=1035707 RepID=A0A1I7FJH9_9BURK|nr:alpha-amylase family glycosyl hydrolase [Pseudoduganella namucuonensis]SFU36382.1 Glycosidase [Pseudoduganella namucuonensis]